MALLIAVAFYLLPGLQPNFTEPVSNVWQKQAGKRCLAGLGETMC
jgi:hypothetical protein